MSDESRYAAMRAYIDLAVQLGVEKKANELRAAVPTETRAVEPNIEDLERRVWEKIKPKLPVLPKIVTEKGDKGDEGKPGKDGIATRAEIEEVVERRVQDINVRTFADVYKGVFKPDELYTRGVLTTWGGSLWLSLIDTKRKPGDNNTDWRLVVKK